MSHKFNITFVKNDDVLLEESVSAVFLVAFDDQGKVLAARNERGWDVPGGHLNDGENLQQALEREAEEEAGVTIHNAAPFAILTSSKSPKAMVFFATRSITLGEFVPKEDALERRWMSVSELVDKYHGDKELLKKLLIAGQEIIS